MTLLALLLASWLLNTLPDLRHLQASGWMQGLEDLLQQRLGLDLHRPLGLALWLLPVGLLLFWLDHLLRDRSQLAALLVQVGLLLHVLRQPVLELPTGGDRVPADGDALCTTVDQQALLAQVQGWFGPVLWFVLLGPAGAVVYRMLNREAELPEPGMDCPLRLRLRWWLNFPVAQLMGLGLAVVDNFAPIIHQWKNQQCPDTGSRIDLRCRFLGQVLRQAVDDAIRTENRLYDTDLSLDDPEARRRMVLRLMQRVQWVWLTVLALLTLGGLLV